MSESESLVDALASDEYEYVDVSELHKHPRNKDVYGGVDPDESFVEDIRENGVETPLIVNDHEDTTDEWGLPNTVIGGHRRLEAARKAGLERVPVRWKSYPEPMATRRLILNNLQREKTPGQQGKEMLWLEKTKRQMDVAGQGSRNDTIDKFDESGFSWRKEVANDIGASEGTVQKATDVYRFAYPDQYVHDDLQNPEKYDAPELVQEVAQAQVDLMDNDEQSFHGGYVAVETAEEILDMVGEVDADLSDTVAESIEALKKGDTSPDLVKKRVEKQVAQHKSLIQSNQSTKPVVMNADAPDFLAGIDDADMLLTDPPYSTDIDDLMPFVRSWLPEALNTIGDDGVAFISVGAYATELQTYLNVLAHEGVLNRTQVLVWEYRNTLGQTPTDKYKLNWQAVLFVQSTPPTEIDSPETSEQWAVQDINAPDGRIGNRHHEWQKPDELVGRFIRHTTSEGDFVVDPFVGTGTTVLKAAELNREAIGCDIDSEMLEIAQKRGCELNE